MGDSGGERGREGGMEEGGKEELGENGALWDWAKSKVSGENVP